MNRKAVDYANALVKSQGKDAALKIATECEKTALAGSNILFYDEADFFVNQNGHLEYSKHQSGKLDGNKTRRIKRNQSFWRDVVIALNKGQV